MSTTNPELLKFTPAAVAHIKTMLGKKAEEKAFRLSLKETGCTGLMYVPSLVSEGKPSDICFTTSEGLTVFIDSAWQEALKHTTVDLEQKGLGQQTLVFRNPNAESLCGCGESFNLKKN